MISCENVRLYITLPVSLANCITGEAHFRLTVLCETKRNEMVLCEMVLCEMVLCEMVLW